MREFNPLRTSALIADSALSHQALKERSVVLGASEMRPTLLRIQNQNCLAKTHLTRRCWIFSSSWSHIGHWSWWGRSCRANLSAVQQRLWATSHIKKKSAFRGSPGFPYTLIRFKTSGSLEECIVCWFSCIGSCRREPLEMLIRGPFLL
jgi:hypothetical protein